MENKIEKTLTDREKLIQAQDNAVVTFKEAEVDLQLLYTEGSVYLTKGINSDNDMKESSGVIARINKKEKEIDEKRKEVTRILDGVKKKWIERQTDVLRETTELKQELSILNNTYLSEKERKIREEKERIEKEKNINLERQLLPTRFQSCYDRAMSEEASTIRQNMAKSWARLTLDIFEERIKILKSYKPKVDYDKILSYFELNCQYLSYDEVDGYIRKNLDYEKFCQEFDKIFMDIKNPYLLLIDKKREELKTQTENQRIALEEQATNDLINQKAKEIADRELKRLEAEKQEANKRIEAELQAQAQLQTIQEVGGRTEWKAYIEGSVDWNKVMNLYIESNGFEKLEFILNWLCKNGRPDIKGIKYNSTKKVINRVL
jgi:hypothetical protein